MVLSGHRQLLDRYELLKRLEPELPRVVEGTVSLEAVESLLDGRITDEWNEWLSSYRAAEPSATFDLDVFSVGYVTRILERRARAPAAREARVAVDFGTFVGETPAIQRLRTRIARYARAEAPVMLLGERGTGKGMLARMAHRCRGGTPDTWFSLNCSALPETLAESELFGHERGAYTGAVGQRMGLFAMAHAKRGGLFLDDVAEFAPSVQPKILQVVEDGVFFSVGSDRPTFIRDARPLKIYAASQPDAMHKLRPDLRDRLCTLMLTIPPLRQRAPDILLLADHELEALNRGHDRQKRLTRAGRSILLSFAWPGNVRQLRNVIARAYILCGDVTVLGPDALAEALEEEERLEGWSTGRDPRSAAPGPFPTLKELERGHITRAMRRTRGNITRAARVLGISRSTLQSKLRRIERQSA